MASPRRRKNLFMLVPNGDMISVGNGCRFGQVYYIYKCPPTCSSSYMIHLKNSITATVVDLFHIRFNSSYDLNIPFFYRVQYDYRYNTCRQIMSSGINIGVVRIKLLKLGLFLDEVRRNYCEVTISWLILCIKFIFLTIIFNIFRLQNAVVNTIFKNLNFG